MLFSTGCVILGTVSWDGSFELHVALPLLHTSSEVHIAHHVQPHQAQVSHSYLLSLYFVPRSGHSSLHCPYTGKSCAGTGLQGAAARVTLHPQIKIHFQWRSHFALPVKSGGIILQGSTIIARGLRGSSYRASPVTCGLSEVGRWKTERIIKLTLVYLLNRMKMLANVFKNTRSEKVTARLTRVFRGW